MITVLKRMNEVGADPLAYTRIALTKESEYIIYTTDENGTEVAFTSFSTIQVGQSVHLIGSNSKQEFFYQGDGPNAGLKLSGPHDLLKLIMNNTMEVEA